MNQLSLLQAIPASPIPALWDYGLAAGLIGMGGWLIWALFNKGVERLDKLDDRHAETLKEIDNRHRQERQEWRADAEKREDRITNLCDEMLKANHENKKRQG